MMLDAATVSALTTVVVIVCAVVFAFGALVRQDDSTGAIWSTAFVAMVTASLAYALWAANPEASWIIAVGNGSFVVGSGCIWLGARRFNRARMSWAVAAVAAAAVATGVGALLASPRPDGWQGALVMFASLILLAAAGAAECLRGALVTHRAAWSLAFVLGLDALYYVSRTTALMVVGPDSALFTSWFGVVTTSFVTLVFVVVATVTTSVLLAERTPDRARPVEADEDQDIVDASSFAVSLRALARRASWQHETVAVVSVRIDDLEQIATAFGGDTARAVMQSWHSAVRRYAPAQSVVGGDGESGMVIAMVVESPTDARRRASAVYRGVFDELGRVSGGVIPVLGVGVGLSTGAGYDADALIESARDAARRAAASVESSVLIGDA